MRDCEAIEKFEPERGFAFSTYADGWVRHFITRELANHSRTIRIPVHAQDSGRCRGIPTVSLAKPVHEGVSLGDMLPSEAESADGAVERYEREAMARDLLDELTPKERLVIEARFTRELTLAEIGAQLGVSRERIRQIEGEALGKLRSLAARRERAAAAVERRHCG